MLLLFYKLNPSKKILILDGITLSQSFALGDLPAEA
jgi:hypothetical protein